jgi:hypothetical protein
MVDRHSLIKTCFLKKLFKHKRLKRFVSHCQAIGKIKDNMLNSFLVICTCLAVALAEDELVGDFKSKDHGVNGTIYSRNGTKLIIKGFSYDGKNQNIF